MKKAVLFVLSLYRRNSYLLSALFPSRCIYVPTCSEYVQECFERHTFFNAVKFSLSRVMRCHPFHKGRVDLLS